MTENPTTDEQAKHEDPLLGKVIAGKYLIREYISRGSMGVVYKAEQQPIGRTVAVKVLYPNASILSGDPKFERRFLREAATYGRLKHPNTVTLFDYGQHAHGDLNLYYMAMEFVEGRTLIDAIREDGTFPLERAVHISKEIARSLKEAHDIGIVHRDLKPSNVILTDTDEGESVKVLDFGIAKVMEEEGDEGALTKPDAILGSPRYMSPEQVASRPIDARSDIYSLGIMLFEMLSGVPPFKGRKALDTVMMHMNDPVPTIAEKSGGKVRVPPEIEAVVKKCLAKDPDARFQNIREFRVGLREAMHSDGSLALLTEETSSVSMRPELRQLGEIQQPRRRSWVGLLLAFLVFLAFLFLGGTTVVWFLLPDTAPEPADASLTDVVEAEPEPQPQPEPVATPEPEPEPEPLVISLTSDPAGAEVWEGNRLHGTTPLELDGEPGSERTFVFKKSGYRDLEVPSGALAESLTLGGELEKIPRARPTRSKPKAKPRPAGGDIKMNR